MYWPQRRCTGNSTTAWRKPAEPKSGYRTIRTYRGPRLIKPWRICTASMQLCMIRPRSVKLPLLGDLAGGGWRGQSHRGVGDLVAGSRALGAVITVVDLHLTNPALPAYARRDVLLTKRACKRWAQFAGPVGGGLPGCTVTGPVKWDARRPTVCGDQGIDVFRYD